MRDAELQQWRQSLEGDLLHGLPAAAASGEPGGPGDDAPAALDGRGLDGPVADAAVLATPRPAPVAPPPAAEEWLAFSRGFLEHGGRTEWLQRFIWIVGICEGAGWNLYHGNPYWTRAQFSADTWAKVRARLIGAGLRGDPDDPYEVGAGVAIWSNLIDHPGSRAGWAHCWASYPN